MHEKREEYISRRSIELATYRKCSPQDVRFIAEREWDKKHSKQSRQGRFLFTSDLHFGHYNILKYDSRPFKSTEEMDAEIIRRWNDEVNEEDTVFVLGDISWRGDEATAQLLKQLKGKIVLIKGNHDPLGPAVRKELDEIYYGYHEVQDPETRIRLVLSHYPIHFYNGQRKGSIMLYGHVHNGLDEELVQQYAKAIQDEIGFCFTMINVGCMLWDYTPRTLEYMLKNKAKPD